jgi:DNA-binding transcriptional LysR family regulator
MRWDRRVRHRPSFRELNILLAVAQAGSMMKAAKDLAISQPAVSKAISDMEHSLGVPLFERSQQGVVPTQYGHALLKRGVAIFDEFQQGVQDIEFLASPGTGELRIGSSTSLSESIVLAAIDRLSRQYPRIVFRVSPGGTLSLYNELRERRVELALAQISGLAPEADIETELLFEERLVVVAGMKNRWVRRRKIELAELVNEHWTWPAPGSSFDSLVIEAFRASGLEAPRATVYADAFSMRLRLAATGRFLAVVPASVGRFLAKGMSLKTLPVELPTTHRQIGVVTLKNRTLGPIARLFIEQTRDVAKALAM